MSKKWKGLVIEELELLGSGVGAEEKHENLDSKKLMIVKLPTQEDCKANVWLGVFTLQSERKTKRLHSSSS